MSAQAVTMLVLVCTIGAAMYVTWRLDQRPGYGTRSSGSPAEDESLRITQSTTEWQRVNCGTPFEAIYGFRDNKLFGICKSVHEPMQSGRYMFEDTECRHG